MHQDGTIRLDHEHPHGFGQMRGEAARVVDGAARDVDPHRAADVSPRAARISSSTARMMAVAS